MYDLISVDFQETIILFIQKLLNMEFLLKMKSSKPKLLKDLIHKKMLY